VGTDHIDALSKRLVSAIKLLPLTPIQRVETQNAVSHTIREYVEEIEDPFKDVTPTFNKLKNHEKSLEDLIDKLKEISTGFGETVKDTSLHRPVTVRRNHRVVIKELAEGTTLRKEVYRSKRAQTCPKCGGSGKTPTDEKCKLCKGKGVTHPVRGVMLEIQ